MTNQVAVILVVLGLTVGGCAHTASPPLSHTVWNLECVVDEYDPESLVFYNRGPFPYDSVSRVCRLHVVSPDHLSGRSLQIDLQPEGEAGDQGWPELRIVGARVWLSFLQSDLPASEDGLVPIHAIQRTSPSVLPATVVSRSQQHSSIEEWMPAETGSFVLEGRYVLFAAIDLGQSITFLAGHRFQSEWFAFPQSDSKDRIEGAFSGRWEIRGDQVVLFPDSKDGSRSGISIAVGRIKGALSLLAESNSVGQDGIGFFAGYYKREAGGAEPGATDNPDDAQRLREDHGVRTSPAGCLSFIVRQYHEIDLPDCIIDILSCGLARSEAEGFHHPRKPEDHR